MTPLLSLAGKKGAILGVWVQWRHDHIILAHINVLTRCAKQIKYNCFEFIEILLLGKSSNVAESSSALTFFCLVEPSKCQLLESCTSLGLV